MFLKIDDFMLKIFVSLQWYRILFNFWRLMVYSERYVYKEYKTCNSLGCPFDRIKKIYYQITRLVELTYVQSFCTYFSYRWCHITLFKEFLDFFQSIFLQMKTKFWFKFFWKRFRQLKKIFLFENVSKFFIHFLKLSETPANFFYIQLFFPL